MNVWHELRNTGLLMTTDNETSSPGMCSHSQTACLRGCRRFCVSRFGYLLPGGVFPGNCVGSKSSRWLTLIILSTARSIAGCWTPREYRVSALTPSGAIHSARGSCGTTKQAVVGWPFSVRRPNSGGAFSMNV